MKSRVVGFAIVAAVVVVLGVQQAQVAGLRKEVAQLRASIQGRQRARSTPRMIPIQGQATSPALPVPPTAGPMPRVIQPVEPRSPFRLIDSGSVNESVERGMKADELEQRRRRREWDEQMEYHFSPEDRYNFGPPWADDAAPEFH